MSRFRVSLLWAVGLAMGAASAAQAATFTVTSAADLVDAVPGDGICAAADGTCTLRAAVMEANALPGADTIAFDPSLNGIPVVLTIPCAPPGCLNADPASGDLNVSDELTIAGNGPANTVIQGGATQAAAVDRLFRVGAPMTISGVTLKFGSSSEGGGAIASGSPLTITDSVLSDNRARNGGAIDSWGDLVLSRVSVTNNVARESGGAVTWTKSVGVLTITESTFERNAALKGSGLSTGGALYIEEFGPTPNALGIINSTFSGNTAVDFGCAIYHAGGPLHLDSVTVADNCDAGSPAAVLVAALADNDRNPGGELLLRNTILSNPASAANCGLDLFLGRPPGFTSEGYNLISDASCPLDKPGDVQGGASLGPLANNGGSTRTHLPLAGSLAIDTGTPTNCPATDQRGLGRPANGGGGPVCDKGSVEVAAAPPPPPPSTGSIQGTVWDDVDFSLTQNGEPGLNGIQLCVFPTVPSSCTTTAGGGAYQFSNLTPGAYYVYARIPEGRINTTPRTVLVSVTAGGVARVDFGSFMPPIPIGEVAVDAAWAQSDIAISLSQRPLHIVATPACAVASAIASFGPFGGPFVTQAMTDAGGGRWQTIFAPPFIANAYFSLTIQATCVDGSIRNIAGAIGFVDPSGTILDGCTGQPLAGATVSLLKNEPYGSASYVVPDAGELVPTNNPEVTAADGVYAWDVVPGRWKVVASRSGYGSVTVDAFDVPPPVTGLDITLMPTAGCNTPPVANNDAYGTDQGAPLTVSAPGVLGNDTDADGNPLTAVLVTNAASGSVALAADGSFTYTPNPAFSGSDSFTYKASDGRSASNVATVTIAVRKVDRPPVAKDDAYTTTKNRAFFIAPPGVLANDKDPEGSTLTAALVQKAAHGVVLLSANGSFVYVPKQGFVGKDTFTYRASDGVNVSNTATVTINVVRKQEHDRDDDDDRDEHGEHGDREARGSR